MYQRTFDGVPIEMHTVAVTGETELQEQDFARCETDHVGLAVISYKMAPARTGANRAGVIQRRNAMKVIDLRTVDGEIAEMLTERLGFFLQEQLPLADQPRSDAPEARSETAPRAGKDAAVGPDDDGREDEDPDLSPTNPDRNPGELEEDGWEYTEPPPVPSPEVEETLGRRRAGGTTEPTAQPAMGGQVVARIGPKDPKLAAFLER